MTTATVEDPGRRDFLYIATGGMAVVGVAALAWPMIDQMNPDQSTMAMAAIEVDLEPKYEPFLQKFPLPGN